MLITATSAKGHGRLIDPKDGKLAGTGEVPQFALDARACETPMGKRSMAAAAALRRERVPIPVNQPASPPTLTPTILLATFEGAGFVGEQIESIRAQTHPDWRLLIRDDGSRDGTQDELHRLARLDRRVEFIEDEAGKLGAVGNFGRLLELARDRGADWIALADQDDHWHPEKLATLIERAEGTEQGIAPGPQPLLLHSDLRVVDEQLEPVHPSLMAMMGLRHETAAPLPTLLVQNFVTGCSCLFNRALLEWVLPVPSQVVMVDWWLALGAAAAGQIEFEPKPLVRYRQHARNVIGAKPLGRTLRHSALRTLRPGRRSTEEFDRTLVQAECLETRLSARVREAEAQRSPETGPMPQELRRLETSRQLVADYLNLFRAETSGLARVRGLRRLGIGRQNPLLDALLKLRLLTGPVGFAASARSGSA